MRREPHVFLLPYHVTIVTARPKSARYQRDARNDSGIFCTPLLHQIFKEEEKYGGCYNGFVFGALDVANGTVVRGFNVAVLEVAQGAVVRGLNGAAVKIADGAIVIGLNSTVLINITDGAEV